MSAAGQARHLIAEAVEVLTFAVRQTRQNGTACDFADFLAPVLAVTAANVGGPEELLAGRPGSWEASHLEALLLGTLGDDAASWWHYRTDPLVVRLNVAELMEGGDLHPGLLGLDDALS